MKLTYSKAHALQTEAEKMPRILLRLRLNHREMETIGLVDSGATVNLLPFSLGEQLGLVWRERDAIL